MLNALSYIKKLMEAGISREQAEIHVQMVMDAIQSEVATKTDLANLRTEMAKDFADFRSEMSAQFANFRSDVLMKMGALLIGCMTLQTAVLGLLLTLRS